MKTSLKLALASAIAGCVITDIHSQEYIDAMRTWRDRNVEFFSHKTFPSVTVAIDRHRNECYIDAQTGHATCLPYTIRKYVNEHSDAFDAYTYQHNGIATPTQYERSQMNFVNYLGK